MEVWNYLLSFCHIFTNVFTAERYHRLFSSLFQIIREVSGQSIQFRHIHGSGIGSSRIQKNKVSLNDKLPKSSKKKRKLSPSNSRTPIRSKENHERAENILSDNEEETFSKEIHKKNLELELKEKEIILKLKHE
ncbi:uncharacterized protein OCT59_010144 [Rhizophagus irregularis]|uniref:uncharacterized protein n=1 Tax=Rhizophagus irregularis TaxID=588596 RepID=UPI003321681F|nr:hypothetical protein OCT59_010144 [Rhizophagus irregularis]